MTISRDLIDVLDDCVVQVCRDGQFRGTGFFIAPGLVITCAHVVHGAARIELQWRGRWINAELVKIVPDAPGRSVQFALPDIAVLALSDRPDHQHVLLAQREPGHRGHLTARGFSTSSERAPAPALETRILTVAGPAAEPGCLHVTKGQLVRGMSGSPVIDERTGLVCGLVKASRDRDSDLGGWIVTVDALARHFPELGAPTAGTNHRWRAIVDRHDEIIDRLRAQDPPPAEPREVWSPSHYLDPRLGVVTFAHRPELDELLSWCHADDRTTPAVRLAVGPGGAGKTRLALHVVDRLDTEGWVAARLNEKSDVDIGDLLQRLEHRKVFLAIDYPEGRVQQLQRLLNDRVLRDATGVRLLLLSRSAGRWWESLAKRDPAGHLVSPDPIRLGGPADVASRTALVTAAYRDLNAAIPPGTPATAAPTALTDAAADKDNVLLLHALALAAVLDEREARDSTDPALTLRDPLHGLLDHERRCWQGAAGARALTAVQDNEALSDQMLVVPTLLPAQGHEQATRALRSVPAMEPAVRERAGQAAAVLAEIYPSTRGQRYWDPMQPDRLGETLLVDVLSAADTDMDAARILTGPLADANVEQALHALTVLARAGGLMEQEAPAPAERRPEWVERGRRRAVLSIEVLLRELSRSFVPAAVTLAASLPDPTRLVRAISDGVDECSADTLTSAGERFPDHHRDLNPLAVQIWRRVATLHAIQASSTDRELEARAQVHSQLAHFLGTCDEHEAAGAARREVVEVYRRLVHDRRIDLYRGQLAGALRLLATSMADLGKDHEALRALDEAIANYQRLEDESAGTWATELADAFTQRAELHERAGLPAQAEVDKQRARSTFRDFISRRMPPASEPNPPAAAPEPPPPAPTGPENPAPQRSVLDLVVPVGHFAGPMYTAVDAVVPESFEVRFRDGVFSLSAEEYAVWAVSHGNPRSVGDDPPTRSAVEEAAREAGVSEPRAAFDSLLDDGLLLVIPMGGPGARRFAEHHQIKPLALGLGNSSENPAGFQIGLPNAARVTTAYDVYHMWLFADRSPTLWDAVLTIADEAREANAENDLGPDRDPSEDPHTDTDAGLRTVAENTGWRKSVSKDKDSPGAGDTVHLLDDPDQLLNTLLRALPILVSTSCVYIDRVG